MDERSHDNLETLYAAFSKEAIDNIFPGETYEYEGVEFVCKYVQGSTAGRFFIVKPLPFVEYFVDYCREYEGGSIIELGIAEGGSTALLALVAEPRKLVAVDLEPKRLVALDDFVSERGFSETVKPYYGVDQSDRARLHTIVAQEFGDTRLDLVLDDASHQLGPTRASFEALFPFLRPGGVYTIEDWTSDLRMRDAVVAAVSNPIAPAQIEAAARFRAALAANAANPAPAPKPSLSQIGVELMLACASTNDVVAEVTFNEHWIMVRRGSETVDAETFRLSDLYRDYFGFVPPPSS